MKRSRKERSVPERSRRPVAARAYSRLPLLAAPVVRGVTSDPMRVRMGLSDGACEACLQSCGRLGSHMRSMCESLCMAVCR